jgi:hypothetical protein
MSSGDRKAARRGIMLAMNDHDPLAEAAAEYRAASALQVAARARLHREVLAALRSGRPLVEVARVSGYHREQVRRIGNAADTVDGSQHDEAAALDDDPLDSAT